MGPLLFPDSARASADGDAQGDTNSEGRRRPDTRCFANVHDVVRALVALSEAPEAEGKIFNVGSQEEISILELAERVKACVNSVSEISLIPYEKAYEEGFEDMRRRVPNTEKIKGLIGWEATTPLDDTLAQVADYLRDEQASPALDSKGAPQ